MDIDPRTLSIFVTVLVIIASMGMALIVDLLKGNVEQLREAAIDLKARKDAAEQQVRSLERQISTTEERGTLLQEAPAPRRIREAVPVVATAEENKKNAEKAAAGAAARSTQGFGRGMSPAVAAVAESVAARMAAGSFSPAPAAAPAAAVSLPPLHAGRAADAATRKNWSEILKSRKNGQVATEETGVNNLIPFETFRSTDVLPAGYHDYSVLQRLAASGQTFTGLVISIGTNSLDRMQVGLVGGFLRSLLDENDFGCVSGNHEFLLICQGVEGDTAQRRLSSVAEKLWDFQLRSMGSINVQFAWGGKDARNESLNEVVAAAIDQMQETRRSRPSFIPASTTLELQQAV